MKKILAGLFCSVVMFSFGQKLTFKVNGLKDTTVHLVKYFGKNLYYADTALLKNGYVEFDGAKQKPGMLALYLPNNTWMEFVYNNEAVSMETNFTDAQKSRKVLKSEENRVFFTYIDYITEQRTKSNSLLEEQKKIVDQKDPKYLELKNQLQKINEEVEKYQLDLISTHKDMLAAKIVRMTMDLKIPEPPKDANGKITDSLFQYHYYRDHFFDNIDLKDERLASTAFFENKLAEYFGKNMMVQHCDSVIKYAFDLCDRLDQKNRMFEFCVTWIITTFQKSEIMGMDKVFVRLGEKYYCSLNAEGKSPAFWVPEEKIKEICENVNEKKYTVLGVKPPNVCLRDTTDTKWRDYYSLNNEYVVLYFWEPTCGHCKEITPKLQKLYEAKLKARNIEVFAVAKATDKELMAEWKKFIVQKKLTFINVGMTESLLREGLKDARTLVPKYTNIESLNYKNYFDIYATPKIIVLDKNKKVVAKQLSISQLEDFFDHVQNVKNAPKIITEDKKTETEGH